MPRVFWLILGLTVVLRYIGLAKGFHSDEGWLLGLVQVPLGDLFTSLRSGTSVYPPLTPLLLHFWMKLGSAELWVRSYFVLFGTLLSILTYVIGAQLINKRFGLLVFFFSSISPLFIWASQFVRSYIDAAFWVTLSSFFVLKLIIRNQSAQVSQGEERQGIFILLVGYVLSSLAALYTSYLNGIMLFAQTCVVGCLYGRDYKFLKKWFLLQVVIGILFLPCLVILSDQLALARAVDASWGMRGFIIWGLKVGLIVRSIVALIGMDPNFLTTMSLVSTMSFSLLAVSALGVLFLSVWILSRAIYGLFFLIPEKKLSLFVLLLLLFSWGGNIILVQWFHFPSQPEYYVAHHALALLILSAAIVEQKKRYLISAVLFCALTLSFAWRYKDSITPEFETKKAANFLRLHVQPEDCVWVIRPTNRYIRKEAFHLSYLAPYLIKLSDGADFEALNQHALKHLRILKRSCPRVWFQRMYGNDEILGANKLIIDWLDDNYYKGLKVQKFKRIDILLYKGG